MLTIDVPLPDPERFLRVNYWRHKGVGPWLVVAHSLGRAAGGTFHQPRTLTLWSTDDEAEAKAVSREMQIRLLVARKMLDLC